MTVSDHLEAELSATDPAREAAGAGGTGDTVDYSTSTIKVGPFAARSGATANTTTEFQVRSDLLAMGFSAEV